MRELTFFTSNATKLAHARYLAEGRYVGIKGFRQRTYHANYNEPRLSSRSALLEASYRSAIEQCTKAGISVDSHPFILEDTSVKIEALSTEDKEYPGLDVKFWMQGLTFDVLDASLKAKGNLRTAVVRSDILLHVPKGLKRIWGVQDDYIVFIGEQSGMIVENEFQFESNLVFPWLDNQTFNKWFQPDGYLHPFGSLNVTDANKVDFRRKAFEKLFSFLEDKKYISRQAKQMELSLDNKINIIMSGYTCSGKTTASQYLARKFGYLHIEASDFMYLSYYYRHGYQGKIAIGDFAEKALAQKPDIAAEKIVDYLACNLSSPIVISGFRSQHEIELLASKFSEFGKVFKTIFVAADAEIRFQRLLARMRPGDEETMEKFQERDSQQERMGLDLIRTMETTSVLANTSSLENYLLSIEAHIGKATQAEINITESVSKLGIKTDVKLEESILIALLSVWKDDESRPFYSTTQIANIISKVFPKIQPKHKDNVSRYFNQDFYAYYEIFNESSSITRRYRLSNTGYGMAVRALRQLIS